MLWDLRVSVGSRKKYIRVWARPRHCANPALQLKLSLKKTVKGTICPLQNLGKKLERKHTRRVLSRYRNCKLKQNVESIFSCTFKVHSKVTFQSHFTEHVRLMLNQAWWTHVAIFTTLFTNMRTQKFKSRLHIYVFFFHKPWPFWTCESKILFPKSSVKMIDGSDKTQSSVGFWTSKFACLWKAQ